MNPNIIQSFDMIVLSYISLVVSFCDEYVMHIDKSSHMVHILIISDFDWQKDNFYFD